MDLLSENSVLKDIPLFSGLSDQELELISTRASIVEYPKDSLIYEQGSPPGAFYCVISGRVMIYTHDDGDKTTILEYLHRGKYFGIISLLTGDSHSVSAKALSDSVLLEIKRENFEFILKEIPRLAIDLSQTLSRRLKNKDVHTKTVFESTIISVFSPYSSAGRAMYSLNLAIGLKKETAKSVLLIEMCSADKTHSIPQRIGVCDYKTFDLLACVSLTTAMIKDYIIKDQSGADVLCLYYVPEDDLAIKRLGGILSYLINDYHYILLDLPSFMDRFVFAVLNQSDSIHILSSPEIVDLRRIHNLVERVKRELNFPEDKIRVIINEYQLSKFNYQQERDMLGYPIFATLPKISFESPDRLFLEAPDSEYSRAIRRVSRVVGDNLVGLVLGVGVAYGFCHIGILKVIEEEKIPVDIICGSSIGAIIASLWATGRSADEILEITSEFKEPKYIWGFMDFTFPSLGFLKGRKLHKFLSRYFGNKTFHDVKLPLKIIASDIRKKESRVFDQGLLSDAIMASCSMPGVFAPFRVKEEMLFDGGIINPLPTEALFKMGIKKIIAVSVTPSRDDLLSHYNKIRSEIKSSQDKPKFSFYKYLLNKFRVNIIDIIFASIEAMQSEVIEKEGKLADIVLHPDTSGLHWLELHRAGEFTKRGEEEARKNLGRIRQLIAQ